MTRRMTTNEAIKIINCWTRCTDFERNEARHLAIEALRKQIPQRCEEVYADSGNPDREFRYFCCPKCTEEITDDWDYCPSCGQAIR